MSDLPGAVVERRTIRHFHLFCDASPEHSHCSVVSSSVLAFRADARVAPRSRHRVRDAARRPVMSDAR